MHSHCVVRFAVIVAAGLFCAASSAETLYKLIDKNGKVTYSGEKPREFDGQVIRIDIDPNANTATLEKPPPPATSGEGAPRARRGEGGSPAKVDKEAQLAQARERLERAQQALQDAKDNPREGDLTIIGNAGGGVRMVPSEAYRQRLEKLESAVRVAREELERVELGR